VDGISFRSLKPWVCKDSQQIPKLINHLNRSIPLNQRQFPVLLQSYDFSKMYTNIDLNDLKSRLHSLFQEVFEKNNRFLLVDKDGSKSRWSRTKKADSSSMKCFDLSKLTTWLEFLIDNIYLKFGSDVVVRQRIGIPMGTNCAVFLANYYLFYFELAFIRKLVTTKKFALLTSFALSKRYIDDLLSINNPHFERFALKPNDVVVEDNITGIYPRSLTLNLEQSSTSSVHFLDVLIYRHNYTWYTKIFDKREVPPLNRVSDGKYPCMDSFLSDNSKYSVLTSQLHRYSRICIRRKDFIFRARKIICYLMAKGYKRHILFARALSFMRKFHFRYDVRNVKNFVGRLFSSVKQ